MRATDVVFNDAKIMHNIFNFLEIKNLFDLRLVSHFTSQVAMLDVFKRHQRSGKVYEADKIFKLVAEHYPRKLSETMIHEVFQRPLRYVDQKEEYLYRHTAKFIDASYQKDLTELEFEKYITGLDSYNPLDSLKELAAMMVLLSQAHLCKILEKVINRNCISFVRDKEIPTFKQLLRQFIQKLNSENRLTLIEECSEEKNHYIRQMLALPMKENTLEAMELENPQQSIAELFEALDADGDPIRIFNNLEKRVTELTQEQLGLLCRSYDIPYDPENVDWRERLLECMKTFARNLDEENKQSSRMVLQQLVTQENEACFTLARVHSHELSINEIHQIIQLAGKLLIRKFEYSDVLVKNTVHRFTDFVSFLNQVKENIPAEDNKIIYEMFKYMIENHGFAEFFMYKGFYKNILNLSNFFNEPSLKLLIDYSVAQFEKMPNSFEYTTLLGVLNQLLPSHINDEQFEKLFTAHPYIFQFFMINRSISEINTTFLKLFFARMNTEQIIIAKNTMIANFNYFSENLVKKNCDGNEKELREELCNYFTCLGLTASYFDAEDVKAYLRLAENIRQVLDDKSMQSFFKAIPHLFQKADEEDKRKLYHAMEKGERYLYSSFMVMRKIANQLPYDCVRDYLQRIMKVELKAKFACFPCNDTIPVLFKIIPLLHREDALTLLHYLIGRAEKYQQDNNSEFDLSDLIFRLLDSKKCTIEDLQASNLKKLSWGEKTLKVAALYNVVAKRSGWLTLFPVSSQKDQPAIDKASILSMPTLTR